jgi:4-hydroxybenzoate polyprenyltransferase
MVPGEVFKRRRRHNNTPESLLLIIANFIVIAAALTLYTNHPLNWFFWVILACLAVYNVYTIRRNREDYNRITIIAYVVSLLVLIAMFFLLRLKA